MFVCSHPSRAQTKLLLFFIFFFSTFFCCAFITRLAIARIGMTLHGANDTKHISHFVIVYYIFCVSVECRMCVRRRHVHLCYSRGHCFPSASLRFVAFAFLLFLFDSSSSSSSSYRSWSCIIRCMPFIVWVIVSVEHQLVQFIQLCKHGMAIERRANDTMHSNASRQCAAFICELLCGRAFDASFGVFISSSLDPIPYFQLISLRSASHLTSVRTSNRFEIG